MQKSKKTKLVSNNKKIFSTFKENLNIRLQENDLNLISKESLILDLMFAYNKNGVLSKNIFINYPISSEINQNVDCFIKIIEKNQIVQNILYIKNDNKTNLQKTTLLSNLFVNLLNLSFIKNYKKFLVLIVDADINSFIIENGFDITQLPIDLKTQVSPSSKNGSTVQFRKHIEKEFKEIENIYETKIEIKKVYEQILEKNNLLYIYKII